MTQKTDGINASVAWTWALLGHKLTLVGTLRNHSGILNSTTGVNPGPDGLSIWGGASIEPRGYPPPP